MKKSKNSYNQFNSEREVFLHITQNRVLISFVSGEPLGPDMQAWNYAHVLPKRKGAYPKFKTYEKNIVLLTYKEHDIWDRARYTIDLKKEPKWQKLIDLEKELKIEYQKLFGSKTRQ